MAKSEEKFAQPPRIGAAQIRLLARLCNACSVSGDEAEVRQVVTKEVRQHADEITVDAIGNLIVLRKGDQRDRLRVMLAAHMDEVGFMLTDDEGDGIFRFETVGGVKTRHLPGKPVWVGREHIPGVIGLKPIHLTSSEELKRSVKPDSLRIDLSPMGAKRARAGMRATFASEFTRLGPSLLGKALDDRIGVATLIQLVKHAPANIDLYAAFTVQEEIGLRGAKVAAHAIDPDLAMVLDCTPANDLPSWDGEENSRYNSRLGKGPAIYLADSGTISDPRLVRLLGETAESLNIPYQFRQPGRGGTDAGSIHRQREGIPSISISVPARYIHTPYAIARLSDWRHSLTLIHTALSRLGSKTFPRERPSLRSTQ